MIKALNILLSIMTIGAVSNLPKGRPVYIKIKDQDTIKELYLQAIRDNISITKGELTEITKIHDNHIIDNPIHKDPIPEIQPDSSLMFKDHMFKVHGIKVTHRGGFFILSTPSKGTK